MSELLALRRCALDGKQKLSSEMRDVAKQIFGQLKAHQASRYLQGFHLFCAGLRNSAFSQSPLFDAKVLRTVAGFLMPHGLDSFAQQLLVMSHWQDFHLSAAIRTRPVLPEFTTDHGLMTFEGFTRYCESRLENHPGNFLRVLISFGFDHQLRTRIPRLLVQLQLERNTKIIEAHNESCYQAQYRTLFPSSRCAIL